MVIGNLSSAYTEELGVHADDASSKRNPEMENAAHQFEASLMQELFAPLHADASEDGSEDGSGDIGSAGALTSFASQAMAKAVSESGGFGIARQIIQHFNKLGATHGR